MPLAAVCCTSITQGKASDTPASASGPSLPMNRPSKVMRPAIASRLRTFGAARRNSIVRIGASRSIRVRAATGRAGAADWVERELDTLPLFMCILLPQRESEQRLDAKRVFRTGCLLNNPAERTG